MCILFLQQYAVFFVLNMSGLLERLREWAACQPNKSAWTFLDDKGISIDSYTYNVIELFFP
jgi:hypothetical protein